MKWASTALPDVTRIRIGKAFSALAVSLSSGGIVTLLVLGRWDFLTETDAIYFGILGLGFGALTWVMITPQPRNGAVWALAWASAFGGLFTAGVALTVMLSTDGLGYEEFNAMSPSMLPLPAAFALWFRFWTVVPALWLPLTFGLLLFPDGKVLSPRWKWVGWWSIAAITVATFATAVAQNPRSTLPIESAKETLPGTIGSVIDIAFLSASIGALFAVISLVLRYRQSQGATRSQIRWIAWGGAAFLGVLTLPSSFVSAEGPLFDLFGIAAFSVLIACYWIAIARHRLYDIDVILSKSVTYLGLAAAITVLYAVIVVGPLLVIGLPEEGGPGLVLPIVATAIVAMLFEPIRSRLQRWANRLVYGERSTPHEVLSQVTARLSETTSGDGTTGLAKLLAEGTGADQAVVWILSGDTLHPEGVWPVDGSVTVEPKPARGFFEDDFTESRPVLHGADLFGALSITKPRNDPISPIDRDLLSDVAAGAGLLLRNISLNRQLEDRARQVHESRRRLIAAQDAERHRLERNLHDGAQQQVVALKVKLGIAKTIAEREEADEIATSVSALADDAQQAVDALRGVAHGIYPPLLEAEGLETALRAVERAAGNGLAIDSGGLVRYPREVEATAYFFLVEAAERARMSGSSFVRVDLQEQSGQLVIAIEHDGQTTEEELATVADRIDVLGGRTDIEKEADRVTRITSRLPTVLGSA